MEDVAIAGVGQSIFCPNSVTYYFLDSSGPTFGAAFLHFMKIR